MPERKDLLSNNILWSIIDRLPVAIYTKDVECRFTYINLQGAKNLHLNHPDEAIGKSDADFFNTNQAKDWIAQEKRIMALKEAMIEKKQHLLRLDGRRSWALISKFPFFAPDGTLLGLFGMTRDITEWERINLAVTGAREGLWYRAIDSDEVWYSPHWKEILGYADDELPNLREKFKQLVHPEDWSLVKEKCDGHFYHGAKDYECSFRMRHKDGRYRWVRSRGIVTRDENDKPQIFAGSHTDVTDSQDYESFYLTVLDTIPNLIFVKGKNLRFVFVNKAVAEIFNKRKDEIVGKTDADLNPDKEQVARFVKDDTYVITNKKPIDIPEEILTDARGNELTLTTRKMPLVYPGKAGVHVLGVATDITDLKAVREDLRKTLSVLSEAVKDIEDSESEEVACGLAMLYLEKLGYQSMMLSFLRDHNGSRAVIADSRYATGKFVQVAGRTHRPFDVPEAERDVLCTVLAEKKSRFIRDSRIDGECDVTLSKECGIISQYIVPIATDSLAIGTLQIDLGSLDEKPKTACEMFDALGAHLSLAIERHRVLHKLDAVNNDLMNQARIIAFEVAAAKILHELNNSIGKYGDLLRDKMRNNEIRSNKAAMDFLKYTQKQILRWIQSVQENVNAVRRNEEEGDYKVEEIVKEVLGNFQHKASAQHRKIRGIYKAPDAIVNIRLGTLLELLSCLITNSFEARAQQIDVIVEEVVKAKSEGKPRRFVQIIVKDNGDGIPQDFKSKIQFFGWSSKGKDGYGMGLTIVDLLVKSMDGEVEVLSYGKSSGEAKTEFAVRIPMASDESEA